MFISVRVVSISAAFLSRMSMMKLFGVSPVILFSLVKRVVRPRPISVANVSTLNCSLKRFFRTISVARLSSSWSNGLVAIWGILKSGSSRYLCCMILRLLIRLLHRITSRLISKGLVI